MLAENKNDIRNRFEITNASSEETAIKGCEL